MPVETCLFERIAHALESDGIVVVPAGLPPALAAVLLDYVAALEAADFVAARVGRRDALTRDPAVRSNRIRWIGPDEAAAAAWHAWAERLRIHLNRRLFLGLFSFESHVARYAPGDAYIKHYDAFSGAANRILSLVVYLNHDWRPEFGGELVVYRAADETELLRVTPACGTIVLFLSANFPHEVLPASRTRYSVAGWFRMYDDAGVPGLP